MRETSIQLRPYQEKGVNDVMAALDGDLAPPLLVLATGGGKSYCAAAIAKSLCELGFRVMIVINYVSLVDQIRESLLNYGFEANEISLVWASRTQGEKVISASKVCLAMQQTLEARPHLIKIFGATHIIEDEWHISAFSTATAHYRHLRRIGMTATPWRLDGGVDLLKHTVIQPLCMQDLIENFKAGGDGLLPYEIAIFNELGELPVLQGSADADYTIQENDLLIDSLGAEFVFNQWQERAVDMPTIAFVPSKKHAKEFAQYFTDLGCNSVFVTDETKLLSNLARPRLARGEFTGIDVEFREDAHQGLQEGTIKVVWAVTTIGVGCDWPVAQCCMLLIRSRSISRLVQFIGRVLRPFKGNEWLPAQAGALVMDFMQNFKDPDIPYPCDIKDWRYLHQSIGRTCECGTRNPKRLLHCLSCGAEFPLPEAAMLADLNLIQAQKLMLQGVTAIPGEMVTIKSLDASGIEIGPISTWRKLVKATYPMSKPSSAYFRYKERVGEEPPQDEVLVGAIFGPNSGVKDFDTYYTWLDTKYQGDAQKIERWLIAEFGDRCPDLYAELMACSSKIPA